MVFLVIVKASSLSGICRIYLYISRFDMRSTGSNFQVKKCVLYMFLGIKAWTL